MVLSGQLEHHLRSLTIRLEEETFIKLTAKAGENSRSEYIRELIVEHLRTFIIKLTTG